MSVSSGTWTRWTSSTQSWTTLPPRPPKRAFRVRQGAAHRSGARDVVKPGAGRQVGSPDREVLAGPVERVTFHNPENGFCVLRTRAWGHRELVTVVGHAATVAPGEWITASGEWVSTHGQQFRASFIRTAAPSSVEGIEKYLGSGMSGASARSTPESWCARSAKRCRCHRGGAGTSARGDRHREGGRAKRITDAWAEQKVVREIMVFLHSHGVRHGTGGADIPDLRRGCRRGDDGETPTGSPATSAASAS